jgi:hypothetical protein
MGWCMTGNPDVGVNHDAHGSPRSSLTSNLVDNLVDLFQGQWFSFLPAPFDKIGFCG